MKKFENVLYWVSILMVLLLLIIAVFESDPSWWVALFGWIFASIAQSQVVANK